MLSRSTLFRLEPLRDADLVELARRALADDERGLGDEKTGIDDDALEHLVSKSEGDARHLLTVLEVAHALAVERHANAIALQDAEAALALRSVHYGDDEHYDIVSAFIKSIRGSDPDAGIYWLARMLEAGEDPLYIARRLVRFASEDIGLADSHALRIALDAKDAFHFLGLPEGKLAIAQCVIYLAAAPKSNSVYTAYDAVVSDVENTRNDPVPLHIRNAPTGLMKGLGYGKGYKYAHDLEDKVADMDCLPDALQGRKYYHGQETGEEIEIKRRLDDLAKKKSKKRPAK